jgi:hypothetical protein
MINGTQVNFQAAILAYSNIEQYQYYYSIASNIVTSDLDDYLANATVINPCDANPCKNDGICVIGIANNFVCLCPEYIIGNQIDNFRLSIFQKFIKYSKVLFVRIIYLL